MTTFARYMNSNTGIVQRNTLRGIGVSPVKYSYNDGSGWRDVTDIDWRLLFAFRRLDWIVAECARKLEGTPS